MTWTALRKSLPFAVAGVALAACSVVPATKLDGTSQPTSVPTPLQAVLTPDASPSQPEGTRVFETDAADDYQLTLASPGSVYLADEAIEVAAALSYNGDRESTVLSGSGGGLVTFGIKQLDGDRTTSGIMSADCLVGGYTIARNMPLIVPFKKSGGFSNSDPDAQFWRSYFADPVLHLPVGRWEIDAVSVFDEGSACTANPIRLRASIEVDVVAANPSLPLGTPAATASDAKVQQALALLAAWDRQLALHDTQSITFPQGLVAGGGWNGDNAENNKEAFYAGRIERDATLSTDPPEPGTIEWSNGTTGESPLLTASEAFDRLIANVEGGVCDECAPLMVTGAHLTTIDAETTRGDARVPAWEFEFSGDQMPIQPITVIAVYAANGNEGAGLGGATYDGGLIKTAYGEAASSEVTVLFVGSPWALPNPCGADYMGEAVESDNAVAVIIREQRSGQAVPCPAIGGYRTTTVTLANPLGDRTVLDVNHAAPVPLENEPPPSYSPQP